MDIANIYIALYLYYPRLYYYIIFLTKTFSPIKTPTYSSIYGYRVTHSAITLTLLLIASTLAAVIITAIASTSI